MRLRNEETQESERQTREGRIQHHHLRAFWLLGCFASQIGALFGSVLDSLAWLACVFVVERSCPA